MLNIKKILEENGIDYPEWYPQLDEEKIKNIIKHCKKYDINPEICAYYEDWEDFCSDWCDNIGYSRTEAREKLHGGEGEFMIFKNWGIIRFTL